MDLGYDVIVTITGIVLVFLILVLLMAIITLEGKIFDAMNSKKAAAKAASAAKPAAPVKQAAAPAAAPAKAAAPQVEAGIPGDVVAAIMAAIYSMGNGKYVLKAVRRGRIEEYAETHEGVTYVADCTKVWTVPCDIALPCATQNEINKESAEALVKGGCTVVCEGANMPSTPEAIEVYLSNGILYGPAKASNAGGVATSGLEMSQNSERLSWSFEEVDAKLKGIMEGIFHASYDASVVAGSEGNLMVGANCAGFLKVATAMMAQGITY